MSSPDRLPGEFLFFFLFSQHYRFFSAQSRGTKRTQINVLLLSDFIKQLVGKGFSLTFISPSPTTREGSVQTLITYLTSFCIMNSQIIFTPMEIVYLFFFLFVDLNCSVSSPFHPLLFLPNFSPIHRPFRFPLYIWNLKQTEVTLR